MRRLRAPPSPGCRNASSADRVSTQSEHAPPNERSWVKAEGFRARPEKFSTPPLGMRAQDFRDYCFSSGLNDRLIRVTIGSHARFSLAGYLRSKQ
jgi:hypothetical protein